MYSVRFIIPYPAVPRKRFFQSGTRNERPRIRFKEGLFCDFSQTFSKTRIDGGMTPLKAASLLSL